ncbi:MAG: transcription-repair coupling factor [Candidatus Aquicultor sp.]
MHLNETLRLAQKNPAYTALRESVADNGTAVASVGTSARTFVLSALHADMRKPMLVVTANSERARLLFADLKAYSVDAELFLDVETMPYDSLSPSPASVGKRFAILDKMASGEASIWVTSVQAAARIMAPRSAQLHRPLILKIGDEVDLHELAARLGGMGYLRAPLVEGQGQFSLRGGIIDIFPAQASAPVRIEFFGDEVDSIRSFNVTSQRSVAKLTDIDIYGCRQVALTENNVAKALVQLTGPYSEWLEEEVGKLKDMLYFEGVDKYLPFLYGKASTVMDYLSPDALVIVDEPEEALQAAQQHLSQQVSYIEHLAEHRSIITPPHPYFRKPKEVLGRAGLELTSLGEAKSTLAIKASPVQPLAGRIEQLGDRINDYMGLGLTVVLALHDQAQLDKMAQVLEKNDVPYTSGESEPAGDAKTVLLVTGDISGGFTSADLGLALISYTDIFGRKTIQQKSTTQIKGRAIANIADLKVGDYVVHSTHGIAVYGGLQRREVAGIVRDYALLEYAGTDRLFVPIEQLDRITKYIGTAGEAPVVSRLGGSEWLKAKKKANASVKKVAYDLLSLYAERSKARGTAFTPDSPWQKELEDAFVYQETPDQLTAIDEVKKDMEDIKPMDRLICGDVGYGKTEVAVRAAFKAIVDGKQVMVLVPTTILAQQHYTTFNERLSQFPVTIEMVSRFRSPAQQKDIIDRFNKGKVDVLIGTHRLLSQDVKPLDLGLVVIDEEQRFGVNHKEKLRNFKKSVDVLTLSATPIPRTLQMSIAGVRDMSVIETPPEHRQPIITHVGRYDQEMIVQAVRRELGRGGQIYYVHNRVETIDRVAARLHTLIPEARVAVAHGQMSEHQLEKIMLAFLEKKYDVLVCTTIIESGIDIPSVNTLIVDMAEILGLAQLYQLRGRVGRSDQRAYAYFFFSPQRLLTLHAFERLKTISDFTELGSGMKIALRDLEIRGAGDLLGAEQHGYMSAIGFELYCQMLRESIEQLEGKPVFEPAELRIDLPINAYLPDTYIAEESLRIETYKRIIMARDIDDVRQASLELKDRFGAPPQAVNALLDIAKLRLSARLLGITEIAYQNRRIRISSLRLTKQQEMLLANKYDNVAFHSQRDYFVVTKLEQDQIIAFLLALFDDIIIALTTEVMKSQKAR